MLRLSNGLNLVQTGNLGNILPQIILGDVGGINDRLRGQQEPTVYDFTFLVGIGEGTGRLARFQMRIQLFRKLNLSGSLFITAAHVLYSLVLAAADRIHVGKNQLKINGLNIAGRINGAVHMNDVFIFKATNHMNDGIYLADVAEELVAKTLAVACTLHQTGNVHKFDGGRRYLLRMIHSCQIVQTAVRHQYNARVRLNGAERVIRGLCARLCNCVKKGAFPNVGKTHNSKLHLHSPFCISFCCNHVIIPA